MKIKIEVPLLEGQSLDAAKLNDALRSAGLNFDGFHHAQAAIVECAPADEQQVRSIIATHLATDWRHVATVLSSIRALEAQVTPRMLREAALGNAARLAEVERQIAIERSKL